MQNLRLEDLSTEQKIGMLLNARSFFMDNEEDVEFVLDLVRNHALGSVQAPMHKPHIIKRILEAADYPIIMINDMEMGYPYSELPPVPMMTLAACNKPEYYKAFARAVVTEGKAAGLNGTWGPVVDVLSEEVTYRVFRKFSDDPQKVANAAEQIAQVFANNHFISCGKHFPGGDHGNFDTHMANVISQTSLDDLMNKKMVPYKHLMAKGLLPTIMSGHTTHAAVDPEYPASLSRKTIDLIRKQGYDGVIFTDSFSMMAIMQKFGAENILGMAIAAGNDIVLPDYRKTTRENYEMLLKNYRDGAFTEERLNEAVRRVLALQAYVGQQAENPDLFTEEDRKNYLAIAKDCITAVNDPGVDAALDPENKDRLFVVLTENNPIDKKTIGTITRAWYEPELIVEKIHEEFPEAEVMTIPEFPTHKENERVLHAATRHKEVVFVTFCDTRPYLGTDCLTRRIEALINGLILSGKVSAVLHFGNPFALQPLYHMPRKLFGYMMPQSQTHAIEVLAGKIPAKGSLPFNVKFQ